MLENQTLKITWIGSWINWKNTQKSTYFLSVTNQWTEESNSITKIRKYDTKWELWIQDYDH